MAGRHDVILMPLYYGFIYVWLKGARKPDDTRYPFTRLKRDVFPSSTETGVYVKTHSLAETKEAGVRREKAIARLREAREHGSVVA